MNANVSKVIFNLVVSKKIHQEARGAHFAKSTDPFILYRRRVYCQTRAAHSSQWMNFQLKPRIFQFDEWRHFFRHHTIVHNV